MDAHYIDDSCGDVIIFEEYLLEICLTIVEILIFFKYDLDERFRGQLKLHFCCQGQLPHFNERLVDDDGSDWSQQRCTVQRDSWKLYYEDI